MDEKTIARKYLQAVNEHENTWDNNKRQYLSNKLVPEIFAEKLNKEERKTGFAQAMYHLGMINWNDAIDICNAVQKGKTVIP